MTSGMTSLGDFGPGGAPAAVDDMAVLARLIREREAGLPLVLFGHSMGAMFSQAWLLEHSALIDALVLSGTAGPGADPAREPERRASSRSARPTTGSRATTPRSTSTSPTRSAASASRRTRRPRS